MNIAIGNDHAGVAYKQAIITALQAQGHQVLNYGTDTPESVDCSRYRRRQSTSGHCHLWQRQWYRYDRQ